MGGIYDFLQRRKLTSLREIERKDKVIKPENAKPPASPSARKSDVVQDVQEPSLQSNKEHYAEKKEQEKKIRKIANRVKSLEHEIEQIEEELSKMDAMLMNPDNIDGMHVYEAYEQLKKKHDEALSSWEKQTMLLEKMSAKRK